MENYVLNGVGHGPVGSLFNLRSPYTGQFDPGLLQPFFETDPNSPDRGRPCAVLQTGHVYNNQTGEWHIKKEKRRVEEWQARGINSPAFNAAVLTRDDMVAIQRAVSRPPRQPLNVWSDMLAAKRISGFDAWAKTNFEYAAGGDGHEVVKSMDATDPGRDDVDTHVWRSVPLPVIHGDFSFPQRFIDVAGSGGQRVNTDAIEKIVRRGWEMVERTALGTETGVTFGSRSTGPYAIEGTSTEYGLTNSPYRIEKTDLTTPTGSNPEAIVTDIQEMIAQANDQGYFGPFVLYHSNSYNQWLNADYFRSGGTSTNTSVRSRIMDLGDISDIRPTRYLTSGYQLILVDYTADMVGGVDGMQPTPFTWTERGGLVSKGCIVMIQVPVIMATKAGVAPVVHGDQG